MEKVNKILLVHHGHTASTGEYFDSMCYEANLKGFLSVILIRRGMSGNPLLTPLAFTHDISEDVQEAIEFLQKRFNNPSFYSAGFSMGGNRLIKYAGLTKDKCPFKAIVSMGTPFYPKFTSFTMINPEKSFYNYGATLNLKNHIRDNYDLLK